MVIAADFHEPNERVHISVRSSNLMCGDAVMSSMDTWIEISAVSNVRPKVNNGSIYLASYLAR